MYVIDASAEYVVDASAEFCRYASESGRVTIRVTLVQGYVCASSSNSVIIKCVNV